MPPDKETPVDLIEKDISVEGWREYDFQGRVYRIDHPKRLFYRNGGSTHRVVDGAGVVHCVPSPGNAGCALRWKNTDELNPVNF